MYLVMNIGCIECGVSSNVVGVFRNKTTAEQVASDCAKKYDWREGGQNSFEVFELPNENQIEQIHSEYEGIYGE